MNFSAFLSRCCRWLLFSSMLVITSAAVGQTLRWQGKANPLRRAAYGVAFSADGQKIVSGSECHLARVRVWDAANGNITWDYLIDTTLFCLSGVRFSASGEYFGAIEELGRLLVFDNRGATPVQTQQISLGIAAAYSLAFSPDNQRVAADGNDRRIRLYNLTTGAQSAILTGHTGAVVSLDWSPDGSILLSGGADRSARLWNGVTGAPIHTLSLPANAVSVRYSTDGSRFAVAMSNRQVRLYDATQHTVLTTVVVPETIHQIDLSDDGRYLAVGTSQWARVYDLAVAGTPLLATFNLPGGGIVYSVDFRPGSTELVLGNAAGDVALYELQSVLAAPAELADGQLTLTPNPASDRLFVGPAQAGSVYTIYDVLGRVLLRERLDQNGSCAVDQLPAGPYWLSIRTSAGERRLRFLKN